MEPVLVGAGGDGEGALVVVGDVLAAARDADGQDAVDEATTRRLRHHGLADSQLWLTGDDGFALRHGDELDLVVRPTARGRGTGTALAAAALVEPGPVSAWSHGDDPAARVVASRVGLQSVRALWVMRRDLTTPLPPLVVPDGMRVRSYESGDADDVLRINAAAFAHHPEQGAMDAGDLTERMAEPWFDPAGLLLAEAVTRGQATGEVLGFHWTKRHSPRLGEVYVVGIDPAAQGRGLGKILTLAGLRHLVDGGSAEVLLYVEADNAPARAVYAGLGFAHAKDDTHIQYHRAR